MKMKMWVGEGKVCVRSNRTPDGGSAWDCVTNVMVWSSRTSWREEKRRRGKREGGREEGRKDRHAGRREEGRKERERTGR